MKRVCVILPLLLLLCTGGCSIPWPANLPAHTYEGTVMNASQRAPATGVVVQAYRPSLRFQGIKLGSIDNDTEVIGDATTDAQGRFALRTRGGYATGLAATSVDGHFMSGVAPTPVGPNGLYMTLSTPNFTGAFSRVGVNSEAEPIKIARYGAEQMVFYIGSHPSTPRLSLQGYLARGVISETVLDAFTQNPRYFFGRSPRVSFGWGKDALVFLDAKTPVGLQRRWPFDPAAPILEN